MFLDTWGKFNPNGEHYMPTNKFADFLLDLPRPLGWKDQNVEKRQLDKIIYCLNIRDHQGYVYFPEVMWAIFYAIMGKNDAELIKCKPMQNIMRKVKNTYSGLSRKTSLDMLCGNVFHRNEITVTKYICGCVILEHLRILQKRKLEREKLSKKVAAALKRDLGSTMTYLQ